MSKQEQIETLNRLFLESINKGLNMAEHLIDNGIGDKDRFEVVKSRYSPPQGIKPIAYDKETK